MTRPAPSRLIAAAALAALALTACTGDDPEPPTGATAGTSVSPPGSSSASPTASALPSSAASAGIDPANPPEPLASATIQAKSPATNDPDARVTVDLLALKRSGKLLVATFAFTPQSSNDQAQPLSFWLPSNVFWQPKLIDPVNLRLHKVVSADGDLQTGFVSAMVASGQTFYAFAVFGAPPESVTAMDVIPVGGAPTFTGVPIS